MIWQLAPQRVKDVTEKELNMEATIFYNLILEVG